MRASDSATWSKVLKSSFRTTTRQSPPTPLPGPPKRGSSTVCDIPIQDTGAFATLLHRGFVRQMHIPLYDTPFSSSAVNLKQRGVEVAHIQRLSVGKIDILGKDVGVIDLEGLIHRGLLHSSPPVAGLLGAEILRSHHAIIDFGTRTLYLRARADQPRPGTRRNARDVGAIGRNLFAE